MILWLASYPRSGNTYFRILLRHFYGISTYCLYQDDEFAQQPEIQQLVAPLPKSESLERMAGTKELSIVKTHELPQDNFPAIYLVRDGRDALLSYAWYILRIAHSESPDDPATFWKTLHEVILDRNYFGGWGTHVLAWTRRQTPTAVITFEDLVRASNPLHIVKQALHRVSEYPFREITTTPPPTFSTLHQHMSTFFRKGQVDTWRTEMPPKLHELFWQQHGDAMQHIGYASSDYNRQITTIEQRIIFEEKAQKITNVAENRLQLLGRYNNELTITEEIIRSQQSNLVIKEKVIHEIHTLAEERLELIHQMELHPLRLIIKRYLPQPIKQAIRRMRQQFEPKLGRFEHYPPISLKIPTAYCVLTAHTQCASPTISIVTPSLNQGQFLERTLRSVLEQHYPALEYIVQDGGSTDETPRILDKYRSHVTYVESSRDGGQAHALNRGFRRATGEILAWLNSDDVLLPGTLAYVAQFFQAHPQVDVVYGHRIVINEDDQEIGRWILPPHDARMLRWADYVPQETLFWRRRIWEKAGGALDESFHFALDWELLLRFCEAGATFRRLPRFLAAFRVHAGQKTSQHLNGLGLQEMTRLRRQIHGREVSNQEALAQLRAYMFKHLVYHWLYRWKLLRF